MTLQREIKVLRLVNDQLRQVAVTDRPESLTEDEIIHTGTDQYPAARSWANYFYQSLPQIAGLAWRPRLGGEGTSYVLFGDRVSAADFAPPSAPLVIDTGPGRTLIDGIALLAHIRVITTT